MFNKMYEINLKMDHFIVYIIEITNEENNFICISELYNIYLMLTDCCFNLLISCSTYYNM